MNTYNNHVQMEVKSIPCFLNISQQGHDLQILKCAITFKLKICSHQVPINTFIVLVKEMF